MARTISNHDDVVDSRDIIKRMEELQDEKNSEIENLQEAIDSLKEEIEEAKKDVEIAFQEEDEEAMLKRQEELDNLEESLEEAVSEIDEYEFDGEDELAELISVNEEGEGYAGDWRHGETLINERYWKAYVQELLEDLGGLPKDLPSYIAIDWDETADNIAEDYTTIDWDGVDFYVRCS